MTEGEGGGLDEVEERGSAVGGQVSCGVGGVMVVVGMGVLVEGEEVEMGASKGGAGLSVVVFELPELPGLPEENKDLISCNKGIIYSLRVRVFLLAFILRIVDPRLNQRTITTKGQ